jgi:UPF0755 protein
MNPDHYDYEPEPQGRSLRPLAVMAAIVIIGGVVVFGASAASDWVSGLTGGRSSEVTAPDVEAGIPVEISIPAGASARSIGELLAGEGVVASSVGFETAVRISGLGEELKAGDYELETGMDDEAVINLLVRGPQVDTYWITVQEGLRVGEILARIAEQAPLTVTELEEALLGGEVSSSLLPDDRDGLQAWEGLLFPDTYEFRTEATAGDVLGRMAVTMESRVADVDWSGIEADGLTPYDGIIIASLIEAETRVDPERVLVSSVVRNRLDIGMALQIDATVLYALNERRAGLTLADLEVDSPYNTYLVPGLPPTPIGAPGRASLDAAAHPEATDYLYYVLTSLDGTHSFTSSYDQFLQFKAQAKEDGVLP